jgi:enoyl-CoA hydratase
MKYQTIIEERHGAVARLITNRPQYKNAQSRLMIEELDHAFAVANADDEVRVIILAAAGDTFSSGHDLGTPEQKEDMRQRPVPKKVSGRTRSRVPYSLMPRCGGVTWTSRRSRRCRGSVSLAAGC